MTVSLGNGVDLGNLVTATTNPFTGGIELSAGGQPIALEGSEIVGLVADSPAAAVANAAAINAALDAKGQVSITTPGVYYIAKDSADLSILRISSDTHFHIGSGVTLRAPPATSTAYPLIVNKNWRSNRVGVTAASCTYDYHVNVATFQAAGHTLAVGDYVLIKGETSGPGYYNGVRRVEAVVPGVSFSVWIFGVNSQIPAATGTIIAHKADANIVIDGGGFLDANGNHNSVNWGKFATIFNKVGNLRFTGVGVGNAGKYAISFCNAWDCDFYPGLINNRSDGVHGSGPVNRIKVGGFYGSGADDFIAFTSTNGGYEAYDFHDLDGTKNSDGEICDVVIEPGVYTLGGSRTILVATGNNAPVRRVAIRGVHRSNPMSGHTVLLDVAAGETGVIEDVTIDGITGPHGNNMSALVTIGQVASTMAVKNLAIRNVSSHGGLNNGLVTGMTGPLLWLHGATTITLDGLMVDGVDVEFDQANTSTSIGMVRAGWGGAVPHVLKRVRLSNITMRGSGSTHGITMLLLGTTADFDDVQMSNCSVYAHNSSLVNCVSTVAGTGRILIGNCIQDGNGVQTGQCLVVTNGSKPLDIGIDNTLGKSAVSGLLFVTGGTGQTYRLMMANVVASNRFITNSGTSHTFHVWANGVRSVAFTKVGGNLVQFGTTSTFNFYGNCADVGVDVSLISRMDGTIIYNTNAALGTLGSAGLVVGHGTAANSWRLMGDQTLRY